jgi:purine-binding chemotaxis protein CheW
VETTAGYNVGKISTPRSAKDILRHRAEKLAQRTERSGETLGEGAKFLEFSLTGEIFAVEIRFVREVYPLRNLVGIPCTPSFVKGVTNLRGRIISVIDIRDFLQFQEIQIRESNKVIVVANRYMDLGILCEDILGVKSISIDLIRSDVPLLAGKGLEFFLGITDKGVAALNLEKIMSDERIIVSQEMPD